MGQIALPENPDQSVIAVGRAILLYVDTGATNAPVWSLLGGQKSSPISIESDDINMDSKTDDGWGRSDVGITRWSIDLSSLTILSDLAFNALEYAAMNKKQIHIKKIYPDGTKQEGWGTVQSFEIGDAHDGAAELSGTIKGYGPISAREPSITPLSATVSKAAATDKDFTISPAATTVSGVTVDGAAITVTTNYTYTSSTGVLKLKSTYLGSLAAGNYRVVATTGDGAALSVRITVTA